MKTTFRTLLAALFLLVATGCDQGPSEPEQVQFEGIYTLVLVHDKPLPSKTISSGTLTLKRGSFSMSLLRLDGEEVQRGGFFDPWLTENDRVANVKTFGWGEPTLFIFTHEIGEIRQTFAGATYTYRGPE